MKTRPEIRFTHWLGMKLTKAQDRALEAFKAGHPELIASWAERYEYLAHVPPIYWDYDNQTWNWADVPESKIDHYLAMCKAVAQAKRFDK